MTGEMCSAYPYHVGSNYTDLKMKMWNKKGPLFDLYKKIKIVIPPAAISEWIWVNNNISSSSSLAHIFFFLYFIPFYHVGTLLVSISIQIFGKEHKLFPHKKETLEN